MAVFDTINEVFQALFFSEYGSFIGLLLYIFLCLALTAYKKELVFIPFIFSIYLGLEYLNYLGTTPTFAWNFIVLLMFSAFQLLWLWKDKGR